MKSLKRKKKNGGLPHAENVGDSTRGEQELHERVAERAYDLYKERGRAHGCNVEDWLEAERQVFAEIESQRSEGK